MSLIAPHVVYSALIVTYSWLRSENRTSVSAGWAGSDRQPDLVLDLQARGGGLQRGLVVGDGGAAGADDDALDRDVERQRRGPRQRLAHGLGDPAPVRVGAVQRGLHERRVGDRPRAALDDLLPAAAHEDAADPLGALAVAHDHDREHPQQRVERLAEAQLVLALGRDATPLAPEHMRITVSFVDSWPSTEMRSNERLTQTPSSSSAVSGASAASVCTKQSIVAKAGSIMPAPLACALSRTVPEGSSR